MIHTSINCSAPLLIFWNNLPGQKDIPRAFTGLYHVPGLKTGTIYIITTFQAVNHRQNMSRLLHTCILHAMNCLLWLVFAPMLHAGESIARIEQPGIELVNHNNKYRLTVHSIAWLSNISIGKFKIAELSGLGWDNDENLLYALSDNGYLIHLKPEFNNHQLESVEYAGAVSLLDEKGRPLKYKPSDSEGLALINHNNSIRGDTELLISFERLPRIMRYDMHGNPLEKLELPPDLNEINQYESENKSLESVALHPEYGIIAGPELPLKQENDGLMHVYAMNGKHWTFSPHNPHYGALVELTEMHDSAILALERSYGGLFPVMEITLHRLLLEKDSLQHEIIFTFDSRDGLLNENFESITRHKDNAYFMISDDNDHPLNRTALVYFSITPVADDTVP